MYYENLDVSRAFVLGYHTCSDEAVQGLLLLATVYVMLGQELKGRLARPPCLISLLIPYYGGGRATTTPAVPMSPDLYFVTFPHLEK